MGTGKGAELPRVGTMTSVVRKDLRYVKDVGEILAHASGLKGLTLGRILKDLGNEELSRNFLERRGKSGAGLIVEACFGIRPNQTPEPDFPNCGVELKTLPLLRTGAKLRVKERTSVTMIDYGQLARESWPTASVRRKLAAILFVFVLMDSDDPARSELLDSRLWHPDETDETIFEIDWSRTHDRVVHGEAHMLSEADSWALAASRKGAGNESDQVDQPFSDIPALRRAFTLKPCFTSWVFSELLGKARSESVIEKILPEVRSRGFNAAEKHIVDRLHELVDLPLRQISERYEIDLGNGKNVAANIIKRMLGFKSVNSRIREFDQLGIEVRVPWLRSSDQTPFEAVSFPTVDLVELAAQRWEESDLAGQLHRLLFVPTYSPDKETPPMDRRLGRAFFWSPSLQELSVIEREWTMFRDEVAAGAAVYQVGPDGRRRNSLTPASETEIIHMRPHGRNARDEYQDPLGNMVTKQCFWLNKTFIGDRVRNHDSDGPQGAAAPRQSTL